MFNEVLLTQRANDVKMTSCQRRCNVITSHRRRYNVILASNARWEVGFISGGTGGGMRKSLLACYSFVVHQLHYAKKVTWLTSYNMTQHISCKEITG